jgi:hypothetical protein
MTQIVRPLPNICVIGTQGLRGPQGQPGIGFSHYATKAEMDADGGVPGIAYCDEFPEQFWKYSMLRGQWIPAF